MIKLIIVGLLLSLSAYSFADDYSTDQEKYFLNHPNDPNSATVQTLIAKRIELQNQVNAASVAILKTGDVNAKNQKDEALSQIGNIDKQIVDMYNQVANAASSAPSPCGGEEKTATSTCSLGMPAGADTALSTAIAAGTEAMRSGGTEQMCKAAKTVQMLTATFNGAHAAACEASIGTCTKSCNQFLNTHRQSVPPDEILQIQIDAAKKSQASCEGLQRYVIGAGTAAFENLMAMATSDKCQKAVSTTPTPGPTMPGMENMYDCKNPAMASQPQCICAQNPHSPVCSASGTAGLQSAQFSSGNGPVTGPGGGAKDPAAISFDEGIGTKDPSAQGGAPAGGPSSGGSGGMAGGGGAQPLPPEDPNAGPGKGPYNTDIMSGTAGGSGGGGFFGGGGGGNGSGSGGLFSSLADKLNLKGFLPSKADFKNRGLASGSGADGITGPNGPSLFEKVSSMYHKKQNELLP